MPDISITLPETNSLPNDLLQTVLEVSLTAINLLRPLYGPQGELTDFELEYLNPAGQHMLKLPEQPDGTLSTLFPATLHNGVLNFYRQVFETGEAGHYEVNYQTDGLDGYFRLAAQRKGARLVVSFTDTSDHDRSPVEQALRASQTREKAARLELEEQREQLRTILQQAPVAFSYLQGPEFRIMTINPLACNVWGRTEEQMLGVPLMKALPELQGQGFEQILQEVMHTGNPYAGKEQKIFIWRNGRLDETYYDFVYQPLHNQHGSVTGVVVVGVEVTEQVRTHQQIQRLNADLAIANEELAATNEELQATNEEFLTNNIDLLSTQLQLQLLNRELETRVEERTSLLLLAQAEGERQKERLERLFMQAPAAVCILDGPELVYELVNPGYQQLFPGRPLLGKPLLEALPELKDHPVYHTFRRVYDTGITHEESGIQIPLVRADTGLLEDRYFSFIQQARYNASGQIDGVLVFGFEVTQQEQSRQRAEQLQAEALEAAQQIERLREIMFQVFEQTPASVAILHGPEHRFDYVNPGYQALFPGRQLLGLPLAEALPETVGYGFLALMDQVYTTGEPFFGTELPLQARDPEGNMLPETFYTFTYQAYQEKGVTVGVSIFAFDVTEQVLARQQRAAQQAQLQALFEQAPVAVAIFQGPEYLVEVANPRVTAIWGRTPEQVIGRPIFEALPEVRDQGYKELLDQVVATGEPFIAQEVTTLLERKGQLETVYLNFVYQPLRDADGAITSVAAVATEVSEQVTARQQLLAANTELDNLNQQLTRTNVDLDNFIYTASHDLKAPITNIEGLLQTLQDELKEPTRTREVSYILELMHDSVNRFTRTIEHLTDVSRLQKEHEQAPTQVQLAEVVEDVLLDLAPLIQEVGARLQVEVQDCPSIAFSAKNLRSVVFNLVSNALKYHNPARDPLVSLRCYPLEKYMVLEVQDNGLGIELDRERQPFQMFQRFHTHVEGSGVGLYMVKKMVENAGGRVEVLSQVGEGSIFTVYFPK
ncbi:PAS domain-containing protein [Hymenobacter sp. DG25A]|uniref:PAS domain-containing protein n=1 Tax=Hymenobacter sp. DG25A TaxID=1385663 RepID=UPI0006C8CBB7|nr:PAS domain-containing protein [Hymenobacter sp. DG25A]